MTDELVERVAWAIAEVLAKRHGSGHTAQGWMGEARREEARAIIPIVQAEQRERDAGIALSAKLPRARLSCSDDESGTLISLQRQRMHTATAIRKGADQ